MDYHEQANHLRLEYPEGEVDFLTVAPVFPSLKPGTISLEGISGDIRLMPDKEILGQKLHYRATGLTGRDLYDFVAVTWANPHLLRDRELQHIAERRRDALAVALGSPNCERGYASVDQPALHLPFPEARSALLDWIGSD